MVDMKYTAWSDLQYVLMKLPFHFGTNLGCI